MPQGIKKCVFAVACLTLIVFSFGCAGRNYLLVDYQVPMISHQLEGQMLRLQIEDQRTTKSILTAEAAMQFPEFGGIFSLAWIMPDRERILAGEHHLVELFKTAFAKRLTAMGVGTTDDPSAAVPVLTIALNHFSIDLQNRKWLADIGYNAILTLKDHPISRENIRGSAERGRIIGRKGADTMLSEIFSDVVNRVDFIKLFQGAELVR